MPTCWSRRCSTARSAGLSRDGEHYFYSNPLDSDGRHEPLGLAHLPVLHDERLAARRLGRRLLRFARATTRSRFHLYGGISDHASRSPAARSRCARPAPIPGRATIRIEVDPEAPVDFALKLRIPGWARGATRVGERRAGRRRGDDRERLSRHRRGAGSAGDTVALDLPMPPERIYAHPAVAADVGRVALKRGPLVYCVEEADNPGGPVQRLRLPRDPRARDRATRGSVRRDRSGDGGREPRR